MDDIKTSPSTTRRISDIVLEYERLIKARDDYEYALTLIVGYNWKNEANNDSRPSVQLLYKEVKVMYDKISWLLKSKVEVSA